MLEEEQADKVKELGQCAPCVQENQFGNLRVCEQPPRNSEQQLPIYSGLHAVKECNYHRGKSKK